MAEVTREMILDYMIRKGGVVKNVDLVRHFRKHLQLEDPRQKERAREIFKERVNQVAYIRAEKREKCLYLKQEFHPAGGLHRPPSGRAPTHSISSDRSSVSSYHDTSGSHPYSQAPLQTQDSLLTLLQPEQRTVVSPPNPPVAQVAGGSDIVRYSYKPVSSPPPQTATIAAPSPSYSPSVFSPPPSTTSPLFASPPPKSTSLMDDDPESLLAQMTAELSNFGAGVFSSLSSSSPSSFGTAKSIPTPPSHVPTSPPQGPMSPSHGPTPLSPPRHIPPVSQPRHAPLPVPNSTAPPLHNSHSPPTGRRLGPAVGIPPSPPTSRALGPAVAIPPSPPTGRRLGPTGSYPSSPPLSSLVWEDRRQGSWDGGHSPVVRVESPLIFSGDSSPSNRVSPPMGGRPPHSHAPTSYLAPSSPESRLRANSGPLTNGHSLVTSLGVPLRDHGSRDGKVGRSHSNVSSAVRRSRNLEKNVNLDSITRASIVMTPPTVRKNRPPATGAPAVAPKSWQDLAPGNSREDLAVMEGEDEGSLAALSEDYYEIDPLEKEWMLATAQGDLDRIHRLIMTDSTLVNRRDFLHGYTAMHWAAKQGRCDVIAGLVMNGAYIDVKSVSMSLREFEGALSDSVVVLFPTGRYGPSYRGFTPLHLAARAGHSNAIQLLIREHGARVNIREHSGKRPVDLLNHDVPQETKVLLAVGLNTYGLPSKGYGSKSLASFSQPHNKLPLERQWSSVGDLVDKRTDPDKLGKRRMSPRMSIRKTFSFRSRQRRKEDDRRHHWDA